MKKNTPHTFNVPEGYFDSFYKRLMERLNHTEASTQTTLIPKSEGFRVPERYFEELPEKVYSRQLYKGKLIPLKTYKKIYYSAAALAAVVLLIFGLTWKTGTPLTFDTLANAEIEAYFEYHPPDMSAYEIAEAASVNTIAWNNVPETGIKEENLWEYLSETIEDVEDINILYNAYP